MSSTELRIDTADGNPYTQKSFIETYPDNGQERWDAAVPWKKDGKLIIRTVPVAANLPPPINETPSNSVQPPPPPPAIDGKEFPSIGRSPTPSPPRQSMDFSNTLKGGACHYAAAISPDSTSPCLTPDAPEFYPGDPDFHRAHSYDYTKASCSSNRQFETLPEALWAGSEMFPQPIPDEDNGCIDWETMIATWTPAQWTEFGMKYFYGYVQQSSLLMDQLGRENENPVGSWGDE